MLSDSWNPEKPQYVQLPLFELTTEEMLIAKVQQLSEKLDRQRKGQFGKIGRLEKRCNDLEERMMILERGLCLSQPDIIVPTPPKEYKRQYAHKEPVAGQYELAWAK
jgi:hypothetical protein